MARAKYKVKIFLKSGQIVDFVTDDVKTTTASMTWTRNPDYQGPKLLKVNFDEIAAVTYE